MRRARQMQGEEQTGEGRRRGSDGRVAHSRSCSAGQGRPGGRDGSLHSGSRGCAARAHRAAAVGRARVRAGRRRGARAAGAAGRRRPGGGAPALADRARGPLARRRDGPAARDLPRRRHLAGLRRHLRGPRRPDRAACRPPARRRRARQRPPVAPPVERAADRRDRRRRAGSRRPVARAPRGRLRPGAAARGDRGRRHGRRGRHLPRRRRDRRAGHRERQRRLADGGPRLLPQRGHRHRLPRDDDPRRHRDVLPAPVGGQPRAPHARPRPPARRAPHQGAHRQADRGRPAAGARDRGRRQDPRLRLPAADLRRRRPARAERLRGPRRRHRDLRRPPRRRLPLPAARRSRGRRHRLLLRRQLAGLAAHPPGRPIQPAVQPHRRPDQRPRVRAGPLPLAADQQHVQGRRLGLVLLPGAARDVDLPHRLRQHVAPAVLQLRAPRARPAEPDAPVVGRQHLPLQPVRPVRQRGERGDVRLLGRHQHVLLPDGAAVHRAERVPGRRVAQQHGAVGDPGAVGHLHGQQPGPHRHGLGERLHRRLGGPAAEQPAGHRQLARRRGRRGGALRQPGPDRRRRRPVGAELLRPAHRRHVAELPVRRRGLAVDLLGHLERGMARLHAERGPHGHDDRRLRRHRPRRGLAQLDRVRRSHGADLHDHRTRARRGPARRRPAHADRQRQ